jgi:gliding motility-associated-like protein
VDEGTYYIKGENGGGCLDVVPVHVVLVDAPVIIVTNPHSVDFPNTVDITQTFTHQRGVTYSYYADANATSEITDYAAIKHGGTYYVKAANKYGCVTIRPVGVQINAPRYTITAPNTFTPNNDGINDFFSISINIENVITVRGIKVYSRYGQLVFSGKSLTDYWNGSYNGKALPTGTYYWVFEGLNNYNNERVTKASSITIIR